ncbi:M23 family metallopeptidase [Embleya sp. NPDC020630]|uniref:M23 family metallopeptidase n=1 Tax=Embleya sp. NPDC020630 TaxID=3363979 RepID=UPI0037A0B2A1
MTDVRYPSAEQQARHGSDTEGAYSPYGSSDPAHGGYDQGYGYGANAYSADPSGGWPAVDPSGGWGVPAPAYDGYDTGTGYPAATGYASGGYAAVDHSGTQYSAVGYDTTGQGTGGYDASGYQPAYDASGYVQVPGQDGYGNGSSEDYTGAYGYSAIQDTGYGTQTQTWAVADTAVQDPAPGPYVDPAWDGGSNTGMWYAASDTAAWESDTWYSPVPVRDDADRWSGGNRSATDLFDDGTTRAPVEPAFDVDDHDRSVPAHTDTDTGADADDARDERRAEPAGKPKVKAAKETKEAKEPADKTRVKRKRAFPLTAGAPLAVMGAAAMAVAAVGGLHTAGAETKDADPVAGGEDLPLMSPMDKQLVDLQVGAEDFAERASRAQTRVSLQERQEQAQQDQEAERKRRESLRPKYVLPVAQKGLSAYFGSSGSRWAHTHTGIDFPVDLGTPVLAVMDGVVRTQVNTAYGNMVILTGKDGTETWYCHLTRAKIRSGPVKAGDVIAYSGDTGNSTGPHLHFEVRPGGGAPINPLPWLRANGLDPT